MKCGIVTVYKSQNCGSFLQAYALSKAVEELGLEPVFYKYSDNEYKRMIIGATKQALKARINPFLRICSQPKRFQVARKAFAETKETTLPIYILGSDTIWDVSRQFIRDNIKLFFGDIFDSNTIISYAPSIGFSSKGDFEKLSSLRQSLQHISSISVREEQLKAILSEYTDKEIYIVCDPTLLIPVQEYSSFEDQCSANSIFIYYYGKIPADIRKEIERLAKDEGLITVIFGEGNPWCDVVEPYDPKRFLGYYRNAKYVVTNTFHGTVFAHIYNKRFAVIGNKKTKINFFLQSMGTEEKVVTTAEKLTYVLTSEFDYVEINNRIARERENGMQFLKDSIGMNRLEKFEVRAQRNGA